MNIEDLHIGMKVRHPQHGEGTVRGLGERTADIRFDDGARTVAPETSDLTPAGERASITGLDIPLDQLMKRVVGEVVDHLNLKEEDVPVEQLGERWRNGKMVLHPESPTQQTKEVPLETFFHKIVMMRNNLRVLEQKVNSNARLSDSEKFDLQQYITRCYGSMTTFNALFRKKEDQFGSGG